MKNQAQFSSKDKSKKLKCPLFGLRRGSSAVVPIQESHDSCSLHLSDEITLRFRPRKTIVLERC